MSKTIRKQGTSKTSVKRAAPKPAVKPPKPPRAESKQSQLIALLKRPDGATIAEVVEALAWQAHYADVRIMPMWVFEPLFLAGTAAKGSA